MDNLPDEIIQNIQSFLFTKEDARTFLLSKSWLRAWSTRPFLYFDSFEFSHKNYHALTNLIHTTLDSYVDQGITIVKLRLRMNTTIQERWLQLAQQCNVIELHLSSYQKWAPNLWREIFMTKSLQSLKVESIPRCKLVLSHTDIVCGNLNTLDFSWVDIDYVTFLNIMSLCPLIEKLMLYRCALVNCSHSGDFAVAGGEFASLKTLSLTETEINDEQLQTILSKSPQLEDFNLIECFSLVNPINLSSVTLKHVKIARHVKIIRIDAPNLRRLEYLLYFRHPNPFPITTLATRGEVNVDIVYHDIYIDASWFHGLREFLEKFAKSNVKITFPYENLRYNFKGMRATPLPHRHQFESLTLRDCFPSLPFFDVFFTIFHPKNVIFEGPNTISNRETLKNLFNVVNHRGNLDWCNMEQNKCWRHYIKDIKLDRAVDNEEKPLDLSEVRMGAEVEMVISVALEWRECFD